MLKIRVRRTALAAAATLLAAFATPGQAATLLVPQSYPSIQSAIDAAEPGSTVLVAPGRYRENLLITKALTLRSVAGARVTTVDGSAAGPVLVVRGTGAEAVAVAGFTLTNGSNAIDPMNNVAPLSAGGAHLESATVRLHDNIITRNIGCVGAGVATLTAAVELRRNEIADNMQHPSCAGADGGGVIMRGDGVLPSMLESNLIARNRIGGRGAGIALQGTTAVTVNGNVISDNTTTGETGGGILLNVGSADILNNRISGNAAAGQGGGLALFPIDISNRARVVGNLLLNNQAADASAALMLVFYDTSLVFKNNVALSATVAPLLSCSGLPFEVNRSNRLENRAGPELGGSCVAGRPSRE